VAFSDSDRKPARADAVESTKLVIAGGIGVGKTTLVASISEIPPLNTDMLMTAAGTTADRLDPSLDRATTTVGIDFGRITLPRAGLRLFLFGTPGQPRFWPMWDDICRGALGVLVLVDSPRVDMSLPAVNYLDLDSPVRTWWRSTAFTATWPARCRGSAQRWGCKRRFRSPVSTRVIVTR
jgi:signal recognition particle receptor subunit beta